MIPTNEEFNEKQAEAFYGGAPREAVQEFPKPGELSEEELMGVMAGPNREAIVEKQFQNEENFRKTAVEREKAAMFAELEKSQAKSSNSSSHTM